MAYNREYDIILSFKEQLKHYVSCVYSNEERFIKEFFPHNLTYEVIYFYMASERCIVTLQKSDPSNQTLIETTIKTDYFTDWCDLCGS